MRILVTIFSAVALSVNICNGSYTLSPNMYGHYQPAPPNNIGQFNGLQKQSPAINFGPNQPSVFPTAPTAASIYPASSGFRSPTAATSPYGIYPGRAPTAPAATFNSYFPSGTNAPSSSHYAQQQAPSAIFRPWAATSPSSTAPSPSYLPAPLNMNYLNNNNGLPSSGPPNKYGSPVSSYSQSNFNQNQKQLIDKLNVGLGTTIKPPTYSISFSTSASVGAGTRFGAANNGNSSNPTSRSSTAPGPGAAQGNQFTGQNGYGTSGRGVGGQPRGLVKTVPPRPSPPSPSYVGGGGKGAAEVQIPKFNRPADTVWGTGPWQGKMQYYNNAQLPPPSSPPPQQPTISQYQYQPQSQQSSGGSLKFSTKSSLSSSHPPPLFQTKEKTGKTESFTPETKTTNPPAKNSQSNSSGLSASRPSLPSYSPPEPSSLPAVNSWNAKSYSKEEEHFGQKSPEKKQHKNSFNSFENEIEDKETSASVISSTKTKKNPIRVKKGSFSWKGPDGKVYEVHYTADALGMHLDSEDPQDELDKQPEPININRKSSGTIYPSRKVSSSTEYPIRIVLSEEEFLKELKSIESDSGSDLDIDEEEQEDSPDSGLQETQGSASNRDSVVVYQNKVISPGLSADLSPEDIKDLFSLQDTFQNSNELWGENEGKLLFPSNLDKLKANSLTTTENPESVSVPLFIPLSSNYGVSDQKFPSSPQNHDSYSYYVNNIPPTPTSAANVEFSSTSKNVNSEQPKKIAFARRHHSYTKSHSSSDTPVNFVPFENNQDQQSMANNIYQRQRQYKRSNQNQKNNSIVVPASGISSIPKTNTSNSQTMKSSNPPNVINPGLERVARRTSGISRNSSNRNSPTASSRVYNSRPAHFYSSVKRNAYNNNYRQVR